MRKTVATICAVSLAAAILVGGCDRQTQEPANAGAGAGAGASDPQSVKDFLEKHELLGKPVLIEFGMADCEISNRDYETMITLHGNEIIADLQCARVECSGDEKIVEKFYAENPANFLIVKKDPGGQIADAFGATIYPVFLLMDKFGNTRYMGAFPHDDLGDWSDMLKAETEDPGPNKPRLGVKELNGQELLASTKLPELSGADQPLGDYAGPGGVMLVFADANCPYSSVAIRELPSVAETLAKAALISTVVVNITDSEDKVRAYYAKQSLGKIPVVFDEGAGTRLEWDVQSVPTIVLFDNQLRLAYKGPAIWADVGAAGEAALDLRPGTLKFGSRGTKFG